MFFEGALMHPLTDDFALVAAGRAVHGIDDLIREGRQLGAAVAQRVVVGHVVGHGAGQAAAFAFGRLAKYVRSCSTVFTRGFSVSPRLSFASVWNGTPAPSAIS